MIMELLMVMVMMIDQIVGAFDGMIITNLTLTVSFMMITTLSKARGYKTVNMRCIESVQGMVQCRASSAS